MRWLAFALFALLVAGVIVAPLPDFGRASNRVLLCADDPQEIDHAKNLVYHGLDMALQNQTQLLFKNSASSPERPGYATAGIQNALAGYFHAKTTIDKLEIPPCGK